MRKRLQHRCLPVSIPKFLTRAFFNRTLSVAAYQQCYYKGTTRRKSPYLWVMSCSISLMKAYLALKFLRYNEYHYDLRTNCQARLICITWRFIGIITTYYWTEDIFFNLCRHYCSVSSSGRGKLVRKHILARNRKCSKVQILELEI